MIDKYPNITIRPRSSLYIHTDIIQSREEPDCQQVHDPDESSIDTLRKLICLQNAALLMLEKSTKLLRESVVLLQKQIQGTRTDSWSSTQQDAVHNEDSEFASTTQTNSMRRIDCALLNQADGKNLSKQTYAMENISVGDNSQQTIILGGKGLVRARNIAIGDGSRQIIGSLSGATLQKIVGSWNRDL
ncbi:hypothetical protein RAB80_017607 [Fusarium oxysporum f. sp. vasinfectum]|nr:hypothetical protein RAB80_017607 [Fusarium oxysporum f. sp. vasinfectum]